METLWIWIAGLACTVYLLWTVALLVARSRDYPGAIDRRTGRPLRFRADRRWSPQSEARRY